MTALYIILGIILFFIVILSVPVVLNIEYSDAFKCSVSWLFIKIKLVPADKKKKKKEKKPKKEKTKKVKEKKDEEEPKEKKENFIKTFYNNQGVPGIIELVKNCAAALGKFSKGFAKCFYITKLRLLISVTESDAAETAIKYGKICSELYPPLGMLCSTCHVKNYKVNVFANYCGKKTYGEIESKVALIPIKLINAGIAFAFRIVIQLIKVLISNAKYAKAQDTKNNVKGGQEQ